MARTLLQKLRRRLKRRERVETLKGTLNMQIDDDLKIKVIMEQIDRDIAKLIEQDRGPKEKKKDDPKPEKKT